MHVAVSCFSLSLSSLLAENALQRNCEMFFRKIQPTIDIVSAMTALCSGHYSVDHLRGPSSYTVDGVSNSSPVALHERIFVFLEEPLNFRCNV